jgi:capsular polysaccharide transport system permease protein
MAETNQTHNQALPPMLQEAELRPLASRDDIVSLDTDGDPADDLSIIPPRPSYFRGRGLFLATFALPVLASAVYLFFIASDRYVSEARFIVRSLASSGGADSAASLVVSQGIMRANDEIFAVNEYIMSRDAMDLLRAKMKVKEIFHRPEADFINRFPNFYSSDNNEDLFKYYRKMVDAWVDFNTNISVIEVTAFRPEDAKNIAAALLSAAEDLVNRLNQRANENALTYAGSIVERDKEKLLEVEIKLTTYRNKSGMIDPTSETAAAMASITSMTTELSRMEAGLTEQTALAPLSPALPSLREKISAQRQEVARQWARVVGGDSSIASALAGFEQLTLEREIAARALASAEANREKARQEAEHQHLYLQTIVAPHLPDQASYPRRLLYFVISVAASAGLFYAAKSLKEIVEDHSI